MPSTVFDHPIFPGSKIIKKTITVTNTSGAYSATFTDDRISAGMQVNKMYIEDPSVFRSDISVQTLGGSFVFSCSDVVGTTDVTLEFLKIADDPNGITSTEFNVLNNRIGYVPSGTTLQGEIETVNSKMGNVPSGSSLQGEIETINGNLSNKVNTSAIANNLNTTASGYVLDARQGKALNDKIRTITFGSVTGTTSSNANLALGYTDKYIISAWCSDVSGTLVTLERENGTGWWAHCVSDSASPSPKTNTRLTINFYYI